MTRKTSAIGPTQPRPDEPAAFGPDSPRVLRHADGGRIELPPKPEDETKTDTRPQRVERQG